MRTTAQWQPWRCHDDRVSGDGVNGLHVASKDHWKEFVVLKKAVVAVTTAALALVLLPGGAHAEPDEVATLPDAESAQLADIQRAAADEQITSESAEARYGWQEDFVTIANHFQDTYRDQYAGAAITGDGTGAWIAFKGEPPAEAAQAVKAIPVAVQLIGNRGFSEAELNKALTDNYYAIRKKTDRVRQTSGSYDIETGLVTLEVEPRELLTDDTARDRLREELMPPPVPGSPITFEVTLQNDLEPTQEAYLRGGGLLDTYNAGCTAGFTVKLYNGGYGIATAEHCRDHDTWQYSNHTGGDSTKLTRQGGHLGVSGDVAWYSRGSFTVARTYYWDWGKTRYVDHVKYPVRGMKVAHFGRTTGSGHSSVYRTGICSGDVCNLIAMDKYITRPGDSGGPWYWGGTAYGIHRGGSNIKGTKRSVFTPATVLKTFHNPIFER